MKQQTLIIFYRSYIVGQVIKHLFHGLLGKGQFTVPWYGEKSWDTVVLGLGLQPQATVSQGFFPYLHFRTTDWLFPCLSVYCFFASHLREERKFFFYFPISFSNLYIWVFFSSMVLAYYTPPTHSSFGRVISFSPCQSNKFCISMLHPCMK